MLLNGNAKGVILAIFSQLSSLATNHCGGGMACISRLSHHIPPLSLPQNHFNPLTRIPFRAYPQARTTPSRPEHPPLPFLITTRQHRSSSKSRASWFSGLVQTKPVFPDITKAGDPVLHEPAQEVRPEEVGSERVQKIVDDMVNVMRNAPGVGLAAPQIGVPLRIIVLEDTEEYIKYGPKDEIKAHDRRPFDLLVIINPKLEKKGQKSALFFEGCLSVDGFRGVVERSLAVQVTGLNRDGKPIQVNASGWQARILQHECDHLDGTLYVDKMVPRSFRTVENLDLPLPIGFPKLGVRTASKP